MEVEDIAIVDLDDRAPIGETVRDGGEGDGKSGDEGVIDSSEAARGSSCLVGPASKTVKGPWSPEEDAILSGFVGKFSERNWSLIASGIAKRSGKSCQLRWCNQLDPTVKCKPFIGTVLIIYIN